MVINCSKHGDFKQRPDNHLAGAGCTNCNYKLLPKHNICIEFNGLQHYYPVDFFGGQERFQHQLYLDKIKKDYCLENNIKLIIISYKDNIEDILKKYI